MPKFDLYPHQRAVIEYLKGPKKTLCIPMGLGRGRGRGTVMPKFDLKLYRRELRKLAEDADALMSAAEALGEDDSLRRVRVAITDALLDAQVRGK